MWIIFNVKYKSLDLYNNNNDKQLKLRQQSIVCL